MLCFPLLDDRGPSAVQWMAVNGTLQLHPPGNICTKIVIINSEEVKVTFEVHQTTSKPFLNIFFQLVFVDYKKNLHETNRINSFILNHSGIYLEDFFVFVFFLEFFHVWKPSFWISINKTFLETQIFECFDLTNYFFFVKNLHNLVRKILKGFKIFFMNND